MSKPERGLPKSFSLKVPEGPVTLGDYLDEPRPETHLERPVGLQSGTGSYGNSGQQKTDEIALESPPRIPENRRDAASSTEFVDFKKDSSTAVAGKPTKRRGSPPRRQFNMSPETIRMLDELIAHVRTNSQERDVRSSEILHALVLAAHEARPYLDLSEVPQRGKWGSANAAAFPVALKSAFEEGMARSVWKRNK